MNTQQLPKGTNINYVNGHASVYNGTIKEVYQGGKFGNTHYLVIDESDTALLELYNAGFKVGDYISHAQII